MDAKSITTLEFQKILDRLSGYVSFSASAAMVKALRPTNDYELAVERQARTSEARRLLSEHDNLSVGGARDVRPQAELAARGGVLTPEELLDIKATLTAGRDLKRFFEKLDLPIPHLRKIADELEPPPGVIEAISRVLSDRGEILNSASTRLAELRQEVKSANDRVMSKLERFINDSSTSRACCRRRSSPCATTAMWVPIKSEFKGRIRCVVQDQSASAPRFRGAAGGG